jgi:hypothetical protein
LSSEEHEELKRLRGEVRELRRAAPSRDLDSPPVRDITAA